MQRSSFCSAVTGSDANENIFVAALRILGKNVEVPEFDGDSKAVFLRADPAEFLGAGPEHPHVAAAGNDGEGIGPRSTRARRKKRVIYCIVSTAEVKEAKWDSWTHKLGRGNEVN